MHFMKKTTYWRMTLAALVSVVGLASANAVDVGVEGFVSVGTDMNKSGNKFGYNVDRLRLLFNQKLDDKWSFASRIQNAGAAATGTFKIFEAQFKGKGIFMEGDTFHFGAQNHPLHEFWYSTMGTRWIAKSAGHEDVKFTPWTNGVRWGKEFGMFGIDFFHASAEASDITDRDDNGQDTSFAFILEPMEHLNMILNYGVETRDDKTANGHTTISFATTYATPKLKVGFDYHTKSDDLSEANSGDTKKDADTVMGLQVHYNWSDKHGIFLGYTGGYESKDGANSTGETKESIIKFGPTCKFAGGKAKGGLFYQTATSQTSGSDPVNSLMMTFAGKWF